MTHPAYTIAICTFNRSAVLRLALQSIVDFSPRRVPVMVVDNNSTDDTTEVVRSFSNSLDLLVYVETKKGLSHARNCAMNECKTDYIIYLDDDAKVISQWFRALDDGLLKHNFPDYFGGPYGPYYLEEKPLWFKDRYGSDHLKQQEGPIKIEEGISGGNMGWRVDLLKAVNGFPVDLGMIGNSMGFHEETYVLERVQREHPERVGIFFPEMKMEHLVPEYKMHLSYWVRRFWKLGQDDPHAFPGRYPLNLKTFAYEIALIPFLPLYYLFRPRERYPYWQNLFFEVGLWRIRFWGRVFTKIVGR